MPSLERADRTVAPTTNTSRLGVVIVSWNVADLLERCLETVLEATLGDTARIVVVDNASDDGTAAMVRDKFPQVSLIENGENVGFARANNQALAALGALDRSPVDAGRSGTSMPGDPPDYVLLLNPDTEVGRDALVALVGVLDVNPGCACVGPTLRYSDGALQSSRRMFPTVAVGLLESTPVEWHCPSNRVARRYRLDDVDPSLPGMVDWVVGAAMMLRVEPLREVGGLDEGYFMYSEELDLCRRLADAGWHTRYEPAAVVVHHEGRSSEQVVPARHLRFMRSRVRYFRKHHGALAANAVRLGILAGYAVELVVESVKWVTGHKRSLRSERVKAYWAILRDGLG